MKNNKFTEYLIKYPVLGKILTNEQKSLLSNLDEYNYIIQPYHKGKYNLEYILEKAKKYKKSIETIVKFDVYYYIGKKNNIYYIYKTERNFEKIFKNKGYIYLERSLDKFNFTYELKAN